MIKPTIHLQELRRRIYLKAKAEPQWRFWGLYVHVCKPETLREAYRLAKHNNGAPGIDGVTFESIERNGLEAFLEQIHKELSTRSYLPMRNRRKEIPKGNGKVRVLGIPTIRDRVVQGALKLILEPIFEADFQPGSFGYRPKQHPHEAVNRVATAICMNKTCVIDLDLRAYFDNVCHDLLLSKVAERVQDSEVMHLLKLILKASGKKGVPQGGVISPLLSNLYLNEVDRMLERARDVTRNGQYTRVEYARFADDLIVLVDGKYGRREWLMASIQKRLREEFAQLKVELNEDKSRVVDLANSDASVGYLGFDFRRLRSRKGKWRADRTPQCKKRTALVRKLKEIFQHHRSQPIQGVINEINPILRGWVNYFRIGNSTKCFNYVRHWVERKIVRHMARAGKRRGTGWKGWSSPRLHTELGLFNDYQIRYWQSRVKVTPTG